MKLNGIFSYFPTSKPDTHEIDQCDPQNVLYLSPRGEWNPFSQVYAKNEANMTDYEGNMVEEKYRTKILLSEIPEDETLSEDLQIASAESKCIDQDF